MAAECHRVLEICTHRIFDNAPPFGYAFSTLGAVTLPTACGAAM